MKTVIQCGFFCVLCLFVGWICLFVFHFCLFVCFSYLKALLYLGPEIAFNEVEQDFFLWDVSFQMPNKQL